MLFTRIRHWAQSDPGRTAVIHNDLPVAYGAFAQAVDQLRGLLGEARLPAGGVAIVLVRDLLDGWALLLALRSLGLTTIALQDIAQAGQLGLGNVACIVVTRREGRARTLAAGPALGAPVVEVPSLAYLLRHPSPPKAPPIPALEPGGHILYSSGTTGTYKKLLISDAMDEARSAARVAKFGLGRDTVFHSLDFGLWTLTGFANPGATWHAGGCVVFDQQADALRNIFRHRITWTFVIPRMISAILNSRDASEPRVDCELMTSGGFLPLAVAMQTIERLTGRLRVTYGATECVGVLESFFRTSDDLNWYSAYADRNVQVVDRHGTECPPGIEGDLRIELHEADSKGYLDDDEASARFFRNGWFYPGDLAVRRDDGRIRILGRTSDVLNVGGVKMAVAPFEEAIQRHLGVAAVCLFSGLSTRGTEVLVVAIESEYVPAGPALDGIAGLPALAHVMAAFKGYRCVTVPRFPRTRTGMDKIQRADLRKLVFERGVDGANTREKA